jgi:hypothetical protein
VSAPAGELAQLRLSLADFRTTVERKDLPREAIDGQKGE